MKLTAAGLQPGDALPPQSRLVRQEDVNRYARASGDFNPIHIDPAFAAATPLGGTVAHGMLVLAYVSQMLGATFGSQALYGGRLAIRFKAPARPGDTLRTEGKVKSIEARQDGRLITCTLLCRNQNGETVLTGEATVKV